ncbi:hypothetical protein Baya_16748 [Bagarius yarrelli]|uniref:Uncharacterized protein n=1 Tax=Bagarius yarrelli TaxID=175774 RepID=A0A556VWI2_BAGYA|nr:hypothetical protein Baya_16748 [Bagarius yarrelli]
MDSFGTAWPDRMTLAVWAISPFFRDAVMSRCSPFPHGQRGFISLRPSLPLSLSEMANFEFFPLSPASEQKRFLEMQQNKSIKLKNDAELKDIRSENNRRNEGIKQTMDEIHHTPASGLRVPSAERVPGNRTCPFSAQIRLAKERKKKNLCSLSKFPGSEPRAPRGANDPYRVITSNKHFIRGWVKFGLGSAALARDNT